MTQLWPRGGLWRHPDFLRLWGAQTLSQVGSQVSLIALPLVAVITLEASAFEVALLGTVDFLPFLLFALPVGVWVDRVARKPVLVLADVGRGLALATIPAAAIADVLTIWQLYAVGFFVGTMTVCFDVAYQSYLPSLVERTQLVEGNSKLEISRSTAQVAGPGAGGLLVAAVTAPFAILVDAVSYLWSAALLFRIRKPETPPERADGTTMWKELLEGVRYVLGDPRWRAFAGYVASVNFFMTLAYSIFMVYAVRELGLSAAVIGAMFALGNIGALAGAAVAGRVARRLGSGNTLVFAGILSGPPFLLVPLAPQSFPVPFLVAAFAIQGFAIVLFNITGVSLIQALTPSRILGRMNASRRFMVWGTIPLGSLTGGVLAETVGLRETLFAGAIGASFCFLFLLSPALRRVEEPAEEGVGADEVRLPLETQAATDA